MEEIRDCKNRLVCKGDARTGLIQSFYKGQRMETRLALGQQLEIERQPTRTTITAPSSAPNRIRIRRAA